MAALPGDEMEKPVGARDVPPSGVKWDTSELKSLYCNVATATSTREEVIISFGVDQNRERPRAVHEVQLLHRINFSPYAAKRLQELLIKLIREHASRYGELK